MSNPVLNAMMPLKLTGSYGLDDLNRCKILFQTLVVHMRPGTFDRFDIVAPEGEIAEIKSRLDSFIVPLRLGFISETSLIPELGKPKLPVRGWRRQMLLKLAYAEKSEANFVLVFDADVICTKDFGLSDLVRQGKGLLQRHAIMTVPNIPDWFLCSMSILGIREGLMGQAMSVTPVLLSTDICRALAEFMRKRFRQQWWCYLISLDTSLLRNVWPKRERRDWSEYSLYFLYAQRMNLLERYHVESGSPEMPAMLVSDNSVWYDHDEPAWRPQVCFSDADPAIFVVYQSSTGAKPEKVWARIHQFVENKNH